MDRRAQRFSRLIWLGLACTLLYLVGVGAYRVFGSGRTPIADLVLTSLVSLLAIVFLGSSWLMLRYYERREEAAWRTALTDPVTELGNRRAFDEALRLETARARRYDLPISLGLLEVDSHLDRAATEQAWVDLAALLRGTREGDRVFRLGDDRFALILPHATARAARMAVERVLQSASRRLAGVQIHVGIATFTGESDTAVWEHAEAALDEARRREAGTIVGFEDLRSKAPHPA
jgi:diguanylate cyclase (GGDEF)-like protein